MRSYTGIPCSAYKTFSTFDWNMLVCFWIKISLRQSEVNDIYCLSLFCPSYHKIVGFDVSMDKPFSMDLLQSGNYLNTYVVSAADGKSFAAMSTYKYQIWNRSSRDLPSNSMIIKIRLCSGSAPKSYKRVIPAASSYHYVSLEIFGRVWFHTEVVHLLFPSFTEWLLDYNFSSVIFVVVVVLTWVCSWVHM